MNNKSIEINSLKSYIREDKSLKKFNYYNAFYHKWDRILQQYGNTNISFVTNNLSDEDQVYKYLFPIKGSTIEFNFNIPYLKYFLNKGTNLIPKVELSYKNKQLVYGDKLCIFNFYNETECYSNYANFDDIILCPFPSDPVSFIIVDGNHRISELLRKGNNKVQVNYIHQGIVTNSLSSAFEVAAYCCLFDCGKIKENIEKINSMIIKDNLFIFDENSLINHIENRKFLNDKS